MTCVNIDETVLMGMGIESVRCETGRYEIRTPGAVVALDAAGLIVHQRIGAERKVLTLPLDEHFYPFRLARQTPFLCELIGYGLKLTVQGDSVLIFTPQHHTKLAFEGHFQLEFAQESDGGGRHSVGKGNRLILDRQGGCGFFCIPQRPGEAQDLNTRSWRLMYHLARYDELWVSICPPRRRNETRYFETIAQEQFTFLSEEVPFPSDELIRQVAKRCQILTLQLWQQDAPAWAEDHPGILFDHPKQWETDRHVPHDEAGFRRVRELARRLGMKLLLYFSPLFSNAPDLYGEMERVLSEYGADGLYFDGYIGKRDDFRPGYQLMRRAKAILGDRILYLHASTEPFLTAAVYCPFVYAYTDFILSGEGGRFGLELDDFLRYTVSQYQISNTVGIWCYYGSMGEEGWNNVVPVSEDIHAALRNHVRFWRMQGMWQEFPEELERFDREYFGGLAEAKKTFTS